MSRLLQRSDVTLTADPSRVVARLFVPGHELLNQESRATGVLSRVLSLPDDAVAATLRGILARFGSRHRDLPAVLLAHFAQIAHRVPSVADLSEDRRNLVGAVFTSEFAIEGAALFNPSAVPHPDQSGLPPGSCRFLLSLRAVGEGHLSSVEFRTGVLGPGGELHLDEPGPHVECGSPAPTTYDRELFGAKLLDGGADDESFRFLVARLPAQFDLPELELALVDLTGQLVTRQGGAHTGELARLLTRCTYEVAFSPLTSLPERVLWPEAPSESRGIEDARFVRCADPDGAVVYRATYTAYDGARIAPQLIETTDFLRFRMSPLAGPAARDKGMALFPRQVGGRYLALSRSDRESSGITASDNGWWWEAPTPLHGPRRPWELIQTGNCGSPIETAAGWVLLTHGVGPMREYAIGALLLDLDDPTRVIGELSGPLLSPQEDERNGYVPNVVYSCGALQHGDRLLLPYGASDASVRFALVDLPLLLERLRSEGPSATTRANSSA